MQPSHWVACVCLRGAACWLLVVYSALAEFPPLAKQLPPRSPCCPPNPVARNVALGHLYGAWARLGCQSDFWDGAPVDYKVRPWQKLCRVVLQRPQGNVAVTLDSELNVHEALLQLGPGAAWSPLDDTLCTQNGLSVGLQPVQGYVLPHAEMQFAFQAILAERVRRGAAGSGCGPPLRLLSDAADPRHSTVLAQSLQLLSEHVFNISVSEQNDALGTELQVEVRLAQKPHWQGVDGHIEYAYYFLGSFPAPCDISTQAASTILTGDIAAPWSAERRSLQSGPEAGVNSGNSHAFMPTRALLSGEWQEPGLPPEYDLRRHLEQCLSLPLSQGLCGNSLALATMGSFEKQVCRLSGGAANMRLSRQWPFSLSKSAASCDGGAIEPMHDELLRHGAVADDAARVANWKPEVPVKMSLNDTRQPWASKSAHFFFARNANAYEVEGAADDLSGGWTTGNTRWLSGERPIMVAILTYGAVTASIDVFADLFAYRSGVYVQQSADFQGRSAVQLLGWGVEPQTGMQYWIAEPSWGSKWGENQYFRSCSIEECRGEFCPQNLQEGSGCADSSLWTDHLGYGCSWYTKNDPGCSVHADTGQREHCPRTCKTCAAPTLEAGEVCGFFRILRGDDHCGIERLAAHSFSAVYSPSFEFSWEGKRATCEDHVDWNDAFGQGCSWYAARSCDSLPDIGQFFNCRASCNSCSRTQPTLRQDGKSAGTGMDGFRL